MHQPTDFKDTANPSHVCKLRKSLYALKQSLRAWFHKLFSFLFDYGFTSSATDTSLFVYAHGQSLLYLLVYVDDIILTGSLSEDISSLL